MIGVARENDTLLQHSLELVRSSSDAILHTIGRAPRRSAGESDIQDGGASQR